MVRRKDYGGSIDNLRLWFDRATPEQIERGMNFYLDAHMFCNGIATAMGLNIGVVAAVLSGLSPRARWTRNMADCAALCDAFVSGGKPEDVQVATFKSERAKAWGFLEGNTWKNGPKTTAFVFNIMYPILRHDDHSLNHPVTVDTWMYRAWTNQPTLPPERIPSALGRHGHYLYEQIADDVRTIATQEYLRAHEVQATIWYVIRDAYLDNKVNRKGK